MIDSASKHLGSWHQPTFMVHPSAFYNWF